MEPVTIAIICAAAFGGVAALSVFIRQVFLSRDKQLNDQAQRRAIQQEAAVLEKLRTDLQSNKRFDSHYMVLGENKDDIRYLDTKIEEILDKKTQLVEQYATITLNESGAFVDGKITPERKKACDRLKEELDAKIAFYDEELVRFQQRRSTLWNTHFDLQDFLLRQEQTRNTTLDTIYKKHTGLLEKMYIRHTKHSERVATKTIEAGTHSFKAMILAPIQFLLQYFNLSTGIVMDQATREAANRAEVERTESDINDPMDDYSIEDTDGFDPVEGADGIEDDAMEAPTFSYV